MNPMPTLNPSKYRTPRLFEAGTDERAVQAVGDDVVVDADVLRRAVAGEVRGDGPHLEPLPDPGESAAGETVAAGALVGERRPRHPAADVNLVEPLGEVDGGV